MALRSFWKGSISFGLVNIPVRLYTATEDRPVKFHFLHKKCNTRIQYRKYCPTCKTDIAQEEIVRGYPYTKDQFVIMEESDFERASEKLARSIEIVNFVHLSEVDPIYYDKAYFLVPDPVAAKAYALLRDAMKKTGQAAIGHIALREKGHLTLLRPIDDAIGLETLYYPDAIRPAATFAKELPKGVDLKPREMEMAIELMNRLAVPFKPEQYKDTYRERLLEVIHDKIEGREVTVSKTPEAPLIDLGEALKASLSRTREKSRKKPSAKTA